MSDLTQRQRDLETHIAALSSQLQQVEAQLAQQKIEAQIQHEAVIHTHLDVLLEIFTDHPGYTCTDDSRSKFTRCPRCRLLGMRDGMESLPDGLWFVLRLEER